MYLYTGLRQQGAARIIGPVVCAKVESVVIRATAHMPFFDARKRNANPQGKAVAWEIFVGPFLDHVLDDIEQQNFVKAFPQNYALVELDPSEREQLARRDGFGSFAEMMAFWDGKLPWYGHIFHWRKADVKTFSARRASRRFETMIHDGVSQEYGV
jgi:hypothetical protein